MAKPEITQDYLRSLFHYDPETGVLTWKERPREDFATVRGWKTTNTQRAGKDTSPRLTSDGYKEVFVDGRLLKAHRVIWCLVNGFWPEEVDHINGIRHDNRLANLRASTRKENMKNKSRRKDNASGVNGVGWHKLDRRWVAHIGINGKCVRLGGFVRKEDAIEARRKAEQELGYSERHGMSI